MAVITKSIQFSTRGNSEVHDITGQVAQAVAESGLENGTVTVFCPSATSALTTIEYESGVVRDLGRLLEEIIPANRPYAHDAAWGDGNGHSHVRSALMGSSLTVPFVKRRLTLGTWQQIVFLDFDIRPRQRELVAQIIGE